MINISLDDDIDIGKAITPAPAQEQKQIRTFKSAGRGRKQCDGCGVFIGVRTKKCICGKEFVRKKLVSPPVKKPRVPKGVEPEKEEAVERPKSRFVYNIPDGIDVDVTRLCYVTTPAGECPYELDSISTESVAVWIDKLRRYGIKRGDYYAVSSIKYFARGLFDLFSDDYKKVCSIIDELEPGTE